MKDFFLKIKNIDYVSVILISIVILMFFIIMGGSIFLLIQGALRPWIKI